MVPMIIIGHILKAYDEKWAKKNFFFKVSDYTNTVPIVKYEMTDTNVGYTFI